MDTCYRIECSTILVSNFLATAKKYRVEICVREQSALTHNDVISPNYSNSRL